MTLLERDLQLAALGEYVADARRGEGRLVLVSGEAGIGKSALLEELERRIVDARWSWGACDGLFTPRPLGPLLDIARELGGPLHHAVQTDCPREDIFQALLAEIEGGARPSILVFEDVHWADEATLDLLRFVARRIRRAPVLLLVTYRDDEIPSGHPLRSCLSQITSERSTRRLDLPRLTPAAVGILAAGSGLEPDALHHLTGGNPYFLTEVLRGSGGTGLPASARDAVLGRIDGLSRVARKTLEAAALLGTRVDPTLLDQLVAPSEEAVDELMDAGLLVPEGNGLRFRHEISRLAVEETIAPHRSAPLHGRILSLLRQDENADDARLAHHSEGAADAAAVLTHATLAARRSSALGAHREAAVQYERALRWAGARDARTVALLDDALSDEYGLLDRWDEAAEARESALDLWREAGDPIREADSLRLLSRCFWRLCRGSEAEAAAQAGLELVEPHGPSEELARALAAAAGRRMVNGDLAEALELADRAAALADDLGLLDVVSDALNTRACTLYSSGREWIDPLREALATALAGNVQEAVGRAYANLYALANASLDFAEGDSAYVEGMAYCESHDLGTYINCLSAERVTALEFTGRWDEALELSLDRMAIPNLSPVNRLTTFFTLGRIGARRGDPDAWDHLDAGLRGAKSLEEPQYTIPARLARVEAHWLAGDVDAAVDEALQAAAMGDRVDPFMQGQLAVWLVRLGQEPWARDVSEPFATQLRGDVGASVLAWETIGCPYDAALALVDAPDESSWLEALPRLDALGATATADLLRRRLREAGARVPAGVRATTRSHPCGLTRREQEVLELVADGLTNLEVADRLFISAKTVDHHVSAVLGKLGVTNRRAAGLEAARLGLVEHGERVPTT